MMGCVYVGDVYIAALVFPLAARPYDHKDRDQMKLDVDRSYGQYPLGMPSL